MKSISLFVDNGTYLTKVHPFTKLMYIAAAISIPLISGRLWMFGVFIAVSLLVLASGKIHGLFNQKNVNVLFQVVGLKFYREGIFYALHIGLNILNMLLSFAVFVLSTKPSEFVDELEKRGFSPRFGYIVTSVFQIIPQMMGTMNTIMDAQRSRGLETEGNLRTRGKAFLPLISPVVMSSLINTRERAIALEVRGFGAGKKKTWLTERTRHKGDREITIFLGVCILAAVVWRIVGCL